MKNIKKGDYIMKRSSKAETEEEIKNETLICKDVISFDSLFSKIIYETLDGSEKGEGYSTFFVKIEDYQDFKNELKAVLAKMEEEDRIEELQLNIRNKQLERFHSYINNDSVKFETFVNKVINFYKSEKYDKRFKYDKPYYFYEFLADYSRIYGRLTIEKENEKYEFYDEEYPILYIHGYYIYSYYNDVHIIKEDINITKDISNYFILDSIKKYLDKDENYKHLRFGQVLFNMNINEFANKTNPESEKFLLRDIHNDSNEKILNRIKL